MNTIHERVFNNKATVTNKHDCKKKEEQKKVRIENNKYEKSLKMY
jgi:hypothetical protein